MNETKGLHHALTEAWEGVHGAESAEDFHRYVSVLVANHERVPNEWMTELAKLVERPWRGTKGRPTSRDRLDYTEWKYFHRHLGGLLSPVPQRASAVADLRQDFKLSEEAAAKLYDQAAAIYRTRPYSLSGFIIRDEGNK
jgi:hypothetical protein